METTANYTVIVGRIARDPLARLYQLGKERSFGCRTVKIEKPLDRERYREDLKAMSKPVRSMVEALLWLDGIASVAVEDKRLILFRKRTYTWETMDGKIARLIRMALGEHGEFVSL